MSDTEAKPLRCKLLGHKRTYEERRESGDVVVDVECLRESCEYEETLRE